MIPALLSDNGLDIIWTRLWRNVYGRLFQQEEKQASEKEARTAAQTKAEPVHGLNQALLETAAEEESRLVFIFKPDFQNLVSPSIDSLPVGTDAWALHHDCVSVTPLRASFAEPGPGSMGFGRDWSEHSAGGQWDNGGRVWETSQRQSRPATAAE